MLDPCVDLPEILLETHAQIGFLDEFTHVSEGGARAEGLPLSISVALIAEACNIGLEPLVRHDIPALTPGRLAWVRQNYIRAGTVVRANARLVNEQAGIPLAQSWGGGEVASARWAEIRHAHTHSERRSKLQVLWRGARCYLLWLFWDFSGWRR